MQERSEKDRISRIQKRGRRGQQKGGRRTKTRKSWRVKKKNDEKGSVDGGGEEGDGRGGRIKKSGCVGGGEQRKRRMDNKGRVDGRDEQMKEKLEEDWEKKK